MEFLIPSGFLAIKKWNTWYQVIDFLIYREIEFLISKNIFCAAVLLFIKYFLMSRNINYFLISRNRILDIKKWLLDIKKWNSRFLDTKNSISWYQEINFISWYQELYFLISRNEFLVSINQFLDIKKHLINSKTAPQKNTFLDIKKSIS